MGEFEYDMFITTDVASSLLASGASCNSTIAVTWLTLWNPSGDVELEFNRGPQPQGGDGLETIGQVNELVTQEVEQTTSRLGQEKKCTPLKSVCTMGSTLQRD